MVEAAISRKGMRRQETPRLIHVPSSHKLEGAPPKQQQEGDASRTMTQTIVRALFLTLQVQRQMAFYLLDMTCSIAEGLDDLCWNAWSSLLVSVFYMLTGFRDMLLDFLDAVLRSLRLRPSAGMNQAKRSARDEQNVFRRSFPNEDDLVASRWSSKLERSMRQTESPVVTKDQAFAPAGKHGSSKRSRRFLLSPRRSSEHAEPLAMIRTTSSESCTSRSTIDGEEDSEELDASPLLAPPAPTSSWSPKRRYLRVMVLKRPPSERRYMVRKRANKG